MFLPHVNNIENNIKQYLYWHGGNLKNEKKTARMKQQLYVKQQGCSNVNLLHIYKNTFS